jgi:hypothetical protein
MCEEKLESERNFLQGSLLHLHQSHYYYKLYKKIYKLIQKYIN